MPDTAESTVGSKRAQSPHLPPAKRAKAAQACLSCRKHKTRCEMLDGDSAVQCHRCKVLSLSCSFGDSGGSPVSTTTSRAQTNVSDVRKVDRQPSISLSSNKIQDVAPDGSFNSSKNIPKTWENSPPDTLSPFQDQPREKVEVDLSDPKRLLPEQQRPWGLLKLPGGFDGTTVPMLAMQALVRSGVSGEDELKNKIDQSLFHILGRERAKSLTDMFEERYNPWLNLPPNYHNDSPLVRLAQCCVASRHLEPSTRSMVTPQLYRLADEAIFKQAFSPLPSTDAIHATLIHSLWGPVGDPSSRETRDGRLLAATAVSMAMNLRLSQAMTYAKTLGSRKKPNEPLNGELVEALDKARLWFALNNVETMLCYGTGRDAIADCDKLIHDSIATTSVATVPLARDMRLTLTSQLLSVTNHGLAIRLQSKSRLGVFYKEMVDIFAHMDNIERLIAPFSVLAEHEVFHFNMLRIYYLTLRLLVLLHGVIEVKKVYEGDDTEEPWFEVVELNGVKLVVSWGSRCLVLAEGVLITLLSQSDTSLLSSAPDNFFAMISLATLYVILSKWSTAQKTKESLAGSSDSLLARTVDRLALIACSPDHSAAKCARVIEEGVLSVRRKLANGDPRHFCRSTWQQQHSNTPPQNYAMESHRDTVYSNVHSSSGFPDSGAGQPHSAVLHSHPTNLQHTLPSFPMNDPSYFNSEVFFDNEFWSSFMANLSDENGLYLGR
ncbi:hypothetical protein V8B97DRAFT_2028809 [Scleroderma yunnanense]